MKKLTSLILALVLCLTLAPASAAAQEGFGNFKKVNSYKDGTFSDVHPGDWFRDDVAVCYKLGLITGYDDGTFRPYDNVTVAEAAAMAARVGMIYSDGAESERYGNNWYSCYVDYLAAEAFAPDGSFGWAYACYDVDADPEFANSTAERYEVAIFMGSVLPDETYVKINDIRAGEIPDVTEEDWEDVAVEIYKLYAAGVLTGGDDGTFRPEDQITRGEMAAVVARMARPDSRRSFTIVEHTAPILPSLDSYLYNYAGVITDTGRDDNGLELREFFANKMNSSALNAYMELLQSKYGMEITGEGSANRTSGSSKYYALSFKDGRGTQMVYRYLKSVYTGYETVRGNIVLELAESWGSYSVTLRAPTDIDFLDTGDRTSSSTFISTDKPDEYGGGGLPPEKPRLPDMGAFFDGQVSIDTSPFKTANNGRVNCMSATMDTLDIDAALEYIELLLEGGYGFFWKHTVKDYIRSSASYYDTYALYYYGGGDVSVVDEYVDREEGNVVITVGRNFRTGIMNLQVIYPDEFDVIDAGVHTSFTGITDRSGSAPAAPGSSSAPVPGTGSTCRFCNGTGHRNCLTCGGKGYVTNSGSVPNYGAGGGSYSETKRCPNPLCHGGLVDCFYCGGDGIQ